MEQGTLEISGAIVFWRAATTDREVMREAMRQAGRDEAVIVRRVPAEDTHLRALKRAVQRRWSSQGDYLIRQSETTITVVQEDVGATENDYKTVRSYPVPEGSLAEGWQVAPDPEIEQEFVRQKAILDAQTAGECIASVLGSSTVEAVRVRPSGGVLWAPESGLESFLRFVGHLEDNSDCVIHILRTAKDGRALRAIREAMRDEVDGLGAEISGWLRDPANQGRKFPKRFSNATERLRQKTALYEEELGAAFADLKSLDEAARLAASKAVLANSATGVLGSL